ncbi:MAG TPA: hypothetical protein VM261_24300 [Kofleriaceae bacterium]|nr:hypothetical protein [Kofleriaceae bacterium]
MPRHAVLLALIAVLQLACGAPKSTTIAYRLPLAGNPGADACYATCQGVRAASGDDAYLDCLAGCPGIEQTPDAVCDYAFEQHRRPAAVCVTARATKTGGRPFRAMAIVAGVVLLLVGAVYVLVDVEGPEYGSPGQ